MTKDDLLWEKIVRISDLDKDRYEIGHCLGDNEDPSIYRGYFIPEAGARELWKIKEILGEEDYSTKGIWMKITQVEQENERLRKALEQIKYRCVTDKPGWQMAQEALEGK